MYPPTVRQLRWGLTLGLLLLGSVANAQSAAPDEAPQALPAPPAPPVVEAPPLDTVSQPAADAPAAPSTAEPIPGGSAPRPASGPPFEPEVKAARDPAMGVEDASKPEPESIVQDQPPVHTPTVGGDGGSPASAPHGYESGGHGGIPLPGQLRLNGRFDLLVEHGGYRDHPFQGGVDRFRNFHHFIFLSREAASDPVSLNVELIDQTFYEFSFHHRPEGAPWKLAVTAGKVLVPFGAEPIFHQSYGGRAGFDQEMLPVIWARLGATAKVQITLPGTGIRLANDIFTVQGHRLRGANDVLDLQADLSGGDEPRVAFGDRLGVSWGALSAWYSLYANSLGLGRQLFMQAIDLELWRLHDVPVLESFSLGLGAMRADVSGGRGRGLGGAGKDYYHFASYLRLRYYPLPWLYLQYRQGIQTVDNRRGTFRDDTRLDARDNATHNVAVVARHHGLSVGLYHFWYLEKADEVDNDFTRLAVAYDF